MIGDKQSENKGRVMKTKILLALASLAVTLVACDKVAQQMEAVDKGPLVMVFAPGFQILAKDASAVPVQGFDECQANPSQAKIFGESQIAGKNTCVVITASTKQVPVLIGSPGGSVTEQWTVIRGEKDRISLQRPDGSLVVAATPQ